MRLDQLPKITKKTKRLGRGYGSGRGGHTVGRGSKGQKARGKVSILFEGTKVKKSHLKRLPFKRGKGKLNSSKKPLIVNLEYLNYLSPGAKVDEKTLVENNIVKEDAILKGVKILGDGQLKVALTVDLPISKSAAKKVEKAGGKVIYKK